MRLGWSTTGESLGPLHEHPAGLEAGKRGAAGPMPFKQATLRADSELG